MEGGIIIGQDNGWRRQLDKRTGRGAGRRSEGGRKSGGDGGCGGMGGYGSMSRHNRVGVDGRGSVGSDRRRRGERLGDFRGNGGGPMANHSHQPQDDNQSQPF